MVAIKSLVNNGIKSIFLELVELQEDFEITTTTASVFDVNTGLVTNSQDTTTVRGILYDNKNTSSETESDSASGDAFTTTYKLLVKQEEIGIIPLNQDLTLTRVSTGVDYSLSEFSIDPTGQLVTLIITKVL